MKVLAELVLSKSNSSHTMTDLALGAAPSVQLSTLRCLTFLDASQNKISALETLSEVINKAWVKHGVTWGANRLTPWHTLLFVSSFKPSFTIFLIL